MDAQTTTTTPTPQPEVWTLPEFARVARVSLRCLYGLMERGEAPPTIRIGRRHLVRVETARAWLKAKEAA